MTDHPSHSLLVHPTLEQPWTLADIAAWAGLTERAAESRLRRLPLPPDSRQPGRTGRNLWTPARVRAAWAEAGWETPDAAPITPTASPAA